MQPAFIPPASYFRLFAAADVFVYLDDVQFNRRWYTHRQNLTNINGNKEWLTLPIEKTDRDTTMIRDVRWRQDAKKAFDDIKNIFPIINPWFLKLRHSYKQYIDNTPGDPWHIRPIDLVCNLNSKIRKTLGLYTPCEFSSYLGISSDFKGQDRIIAICKKLKATEYINSPGGRELYNAEDFARHGIKLTFLPEWNGSYDSVIERLCGESSESIRKEIYEQT